MSPENIIWKSSDSVWVPHSKNIEVKLPRKREPKISLLQTGGKPSTWFPPGRLVELLRETTSTHI